MENQVHSNNCKIESPDYQMDISDVTDNISQTSLSPTISNQVDIDSESNVVKNNSEEIIESSINSLKLNETTMKKQDDENIENRNILNLSCSSSNDQQQNTMMKKLTPVRNHPLMMFDDNDLENSSTISNSTNVRNFLDVVLMTHNQQQKPKAKTSSSDLVNSMNNNDNRNHHNFAKYREPSPVSNHLNYRKKLEVADIS
ncbi:hypothetical protein PVAND_008686 [Polypedilum vanderplanki]|uniref:Uncharacterized protein n=1 Tax=Polypedilum vanderplanki TaxID=319348 RepID=A0A9J6CAD9_POLVA|nr:hypothetical protein PVAND_008686 [Polypedilum vanderplanki]